MTRALMTNRTSCHIADGTKQVLWATFRRQEAPLVCRSAASSASAHMGRLNKLMVARADARHAQPMEGENGMPQPFKYTAARRAPRLACCG